MIRRISVIYGFFMSRVAMKTIAYRLQLCMEFYTKKLSSRQIMVVITKYV